MRFTDIKRAFHQEKNKFKRRLDAEKVLRRFHPIKSTEPLPETITLGSNRPQSNRKDGLSNHRYKKILLVGKIWKLHKIRLEKQKLGRRLTSEEIQKI
jgi:hypothetical protein